MSDIFLTGHTGFLGSHLLPRLHELGYSVETNLRYLHSKKWDRIVHLAAVTHIRPEFDPALIEANIILTKEIFKSSARVLYASSCSAAYNSNPYAQTKMYAEHLGRIHGNALGFRFHNVYGPNNNKGIVKYLFDQRNGAKITVRGPDLLRDYVYYSEIIDEILFYIKYDMLATTVLSTNTTFISERCGVVDIGTGIATSTMDLVNLYQKLSGKIFDISVSDAGANEPACMVSNRNCCIISLEQGLKKMIDESR